MNNVTPNQPILIAEDSEDDYEAVHRAFKKANNLVNLPMIMHHAQVLYCSI